MAWIYIGYLLAVGFTILMAAFLAGFAWTRRTIPGARSFTVAALSVCEIASMYFLISTSTSPDVAYLYARLRFIGLSLIAITFFYFVINYTGKRAWLSPVAQIALYVVPIITMFVVILTPSLFFESWQLLHLDYISVESTRFVGWYWIYYIYSYLLIGLSVIWLIYYALRVDSSLRGGAFWVTGSVVLGLALTTPDIPGIKLTPIGFGFVGLGMAMALFRYRLFDVVPIAYDAVVKSMQEAVFIINERKEIVQVNPVAEKLLNRTQSDVLGKPLKTVVNIEQELLEKYENVLEARFEYTSVRDGKPSIHDVRISPLYRGDRLVGQLIVLYDITERKQALDAERKQRILFESLLDTIAALKSSLSFEEILDRILASLTRVIDYETANVSLIKNGLVEVVRLHGYNTPELAERKRRSSCAVSETYHFRCMVSTKQPLVLTDTSNSPEWASIKDGEQIKSYMGVPILIEDNVIGFLSLESPMPSFFKEDDIEKLKAFTDQVAVALQNARAFEHATELAALEERQRLARDLHDAVSQTLFAASMVAQTLPLLWDSDKDEVRNGLDELARLTRGAMAEMRTLLIELRPTALTNADLADLLTYMLDAVAGRTQIKVALEVEGKQALPAEAQVVLYRIAQEALNNVAKHAQAKQVTVVLRRLNGNIELRIRDNGRGFDPSRIPADHFGVKIMHERAASINAQLTLSSQIGQGSEMLLTWSAPEPIPQ